MFVASHDLCEVRIESDIQLYPRIILAECCRRIYDLEHQALAFLKRLAFVKPPRVLEENRTRGCLELGHSLSRVARECVLVRNPPIAQYPCGLSLVGGGDIPPHTNAMDQSAASDVSLAYLKQG